MKKQLEIIPTKTWLPNAKKPILISGPCSAENEDQLVSTAMELKETGTVNVLRAGIWKPRTRPNAFEGVGEIGLEWLTAAKKETGLPVATEVANAKHVEICLKHGVDILWVGARTTVNPFSVQEIADALKGVDIPVMVKNPVNPDVQLWVGAIERLYQAGITKLAAIHRGFSSFEKTPFRNVPKWEIPIELKSIFPEIDIICDPSHIAGNRELIPLISQKALDLDMAGLMIESHIQPDAALSDAHQQITPKQLGKLMNELVVRQATSSNQDFKDQLGTLRNSIDEIDDEILQKLYNRMQVVEKIGQYKKSNNVTILQIKRWDEIIEKRLKMSRAMGISEEFTKKLLELIHKESIRKQIEIMNKSVSVE